MPLPTYAPTMLTALLPEVLLLALAGLVLLVDLIGLPRRRRGLGWLTAVGVGVAPLGLCLMAAAADLIMLYLAIETASISLYVLAGYLKGNDKSTESGLKYFLFGALTSAVMLYGFS